MFGYVVRQIVTKLLVVIVTTMFVFAVFGYGPNDPATVICSKSGRCTAQKVELISHSLGLDKPVPQRYVTWVKGLFTGREMSIGPGNTFECPAPCLGISYWTYEPVTKGLEKRYPATLTLGVGGGIGMLLLGVAVGSLAARMRGGPVDKGLMGGLMVWYSVPYFIIALLSWLFLYNLWHIFPETGYFGLTNHPGKTLAGMLLPWLVLSCTGATQYARYTRNEMATTLGEDYITAARAKGVRRPKVVFKHGLRAALVPIVTIFGLNWSYLLSGTVFTEVIFQINGAGAWGIRSIQNLDYPVVQGVVVVTATFIVVGTLLVDLAYSVLDPRVRLV